MKWFDPIASGASHIVGHPLAIFIAAFGTSAGMAFVGIESTNIAVSIVSLVLLCLLQHTQNRDGLAIQVKLDELIRAVKGARDDIAGIDEKTEDEIRELRQ